MPLNAQKVMLALLAIQLFVQGAVWLHKWVGQQEGEPHERRKDFNSLSDRVRIVEGRMNDYDERNSKNMSRIQDKMGEMELDIRELKTLERVKHGPPGV